MVQCAKSSSFEENQQKLLSYVMDHHYPPIVLDLIPKSSAKPNIPNQDDTKMIITTRERLARQEVVQLELAKLRVILGILRRESNGQLEAI